MYIDTQLEVILFASQLRLEVAKTAPLTKLG